MPMPDDAQRVSEGLIPQTTSYGARARRGQDGHTEDKRTKEGSPSESVGRTSSSDRRAAHGVRRQGAANVHPPRQPAGIGRRMLLLVIMLLMSTSYSVAAACERLIWIKV